VGVNPDLGNWMYQPVGTWEEVLRRLAPHTNYWHVKNYRTVWGTEETHEGQAIQLFPTSLQSGDIDYRIAVQIMKEFGFAGWVCIEWVNPGDPLPVLEQDRAYLAELFGSGRLRSR
jgi:sugar phosphate isomerase/epimerase